MRKKITVTENYLLILSDEEIKSIDHWLNRDNNSINNGELYPLANNAPSCKLITHHLPLNGAKPLDGVMMFPELEDEVEKLLEEEANLHATLSPKAFKRGLSIGYNKAREKYRFTEEDMEKAFIKGISLQCDFPTFLESLQQPRYPTHFDFEMEEDKDVLVHDIKEFLEELGDKPKIINGVAIGKYLYE